MPAPVARYKILPARGDLAALTAAIADIAEGEIAYAIDEGLYYQKQGGVLEPVGIPEAPEDGTQYVRNNAAWEAVDVPPGTVVGDTPPESPDQGQQWYDTGTARLFLWTGSEWVDASPDAESASFLVSETAPENANEGDGWFNESNGKTYVYVDGVWVQSTHTDMALLDGSVTPAKLSTGGPSWDVSGNATFAGDIFTGTFDINDDTKKGSYLGSGGGLVLRNDRRSSVDSAFTIQGGTGGQIAAQGVVVDIKTDGSAELAGTILSGTTTNPNSGTGSWMQAGGGIYTTRPAGSTDAAFAAYQQGSASAPSAVINADGSATFADNVSVDKYLTVTNSELSGSARVQIQGDNDVAIGVYPAAVSGSRTIELRHNGSATFASDIQTGNPTSEGRYTAYSPTASSTADAFNIFRGSTALSSRTVNIAYDGSAEFAKTITSGPTTASVGTNYLTLGGNFDVGTDTGNAFAVYRSDNTIYASIKNDGRATFKNETTVPYLYVRPSLMDVGAAAESDWSSFRSFDFSGAQSSAIYADGSAVFGDYSTNGTTIFGSGSVSVNRNGSGSTCYYAMLNGTVMATISAGGVIKTGDTSVNGGVQMVTEDIGSASQRGRQTFVAKAGASGAQEMLQGYIGGTEQLRITINGNIQNTNNAYTGLSDGTLKENIVPASAQWDNIKDIELVNFNFKEDLGYETHKQLGVIAQQVEEVSPGLVNTDEEGLKSVNYSVLNLKAIKALQEAMERIESLEAEVAALKQS